MKNVYDFTYSDKHALIGDFYHQEGIYLNIDMAPVDKTPIDSPYAYDSFCIFKSEKFIPGCTCEYSDRMQEWDLDKFIRCAKKVFGINCGQSFTYKNPKDIEKFLSLYFNKDIKLLAIEQHCNLATGYPYWSFYTIDKEEYDKMPKQNKTTDERASDILAGTMSDELKLHKIFELYKDDIRRFNVNLYYALLGWYDSSFYKNLIELRLYNKNKNIKENGQSPDSVTVRASYDFEVDTSDFDSKHVDIDGLSIDLTKKEVESLKADDFSYKIINESFDKINIKDLENAFSESDKEEH